MVASWHPIPFLSTARGITAHGVQGGEHARQRPQGYPVANFHAGNAWEFFDVIRVGSKFSSSMTTQEMLEKKGSRGDLIIFVSELMYWDQHGDLPAKCYGTLIMFPIASMGTSRSMNVDRLGENLIYERTTQQYNEEQLEEIIEDIDNHKRRGAETLYWEDVNVGDKVGPFGDCAMDPARLRRSPCGGRVQPWQPTVAGRRNWRLRSSSASYDK